MKTRTLVTLCLLMSCARGQTTEERRVAKECAGVADDRLAALRGFVREQPSDATHGRIVTDARAWARGSPSDECVAAVVREVLALQGRTDEMVTRERRRTQDRAEWDSLTTIEQRWVLVALDRARSLNGYLGCTCAGIGDLGFIDDALTVAAVVSPTEAIVERRALRDAEQRIEDSRAAQGLKPKHVSLRPPLWLSGFSVAGLADGSEIKLAKPVHVTGTRTYASPDGAARTVFIIEQLDIDTAKLAKVIPPADRKSVV